MEQTTQQQVSHPKTIVKILIVDLVTLDGANNCADGKTVMGQEVADFIKSYGGVIHYDDQANVIDVQKRAVLASSLEDESQPPHYHFFYLPYLSDADDISSLTSKGQYDGVIAAATIIPFAAKFRLGGVRIGAGTGNMQSESFSVNSGTHSPLMNTPSFNSRVTAQMVFKAILANRPKVDWHKMHQQVVAGQFDTGRDLINHSTKALFGYTIAILGFGHIGREVAKLAQSFAMTVKVFARPKHQQWIESMGYWYCDSPQAAVTGADILSPHLGLGANQCNVGLIDEPLLMALNDDALVVNFDRGELIDIKGLKAAFNADKVGHAVIDADIFVDEQGNNCGPLQAYRGLCDDFAQKLTLLPHVAADIDHLSRVAGAKQAIKQLITAISEKVVINGVGDSLASYHKAGYQNTGFINGGKQTLCGIGSVSAERFDALSDNQVTQMSELSGDIAQFWQKLAQGQPVDDSRSIEEITLMHNQLNQLLARYGLTGTVN